jgi:hypothetical protein
LLVNQPLGFQNLWQSSVNHLSILARQYRMCR